MFVIDIYQHFRNEEQELIDQLMDKCEQADSHYAPVLTAFLDPRGQYILEVIVGSYEDLNVTYNGDHMLKENVLSLHLPIMNHKKKIMKFRSFK